MKDLIENFSGLLEESVSIAEQSPFQLDRTIQNILICGMGGSGIGGEIAKQIALEYASIPIETNHGYAIPAYVNDKTLVIACSYSGNTEETISAVQKAIEKNALVVGVTSGGKLQELLKEIDAHIRIVPGGLPPRAALPYPLVQLLDLLVKANAIPARVFDQLKSSIAFLRDRQSEIIRMAEKAIDFADQRLLLYAEEQFGPILLRIKQQMNENGKELAYFNVIPEMNHNEIVGWAKECSDFSVFFIRSNFENERNSKRLDITEQIVSKKAPIMRIEAQGDNLVEQYMYINHLFDWVSFFKAERNGVDVVEVNVIDFLKAELAR